MKMRLFFCLVLSVAIHLLVLLTPWQGLARHEVAPPPMPAAEVGLVEQMPELPPEPEPEDPPEPEEDLSFTVDGKVSDGYMDRLKSSVFHAWIYPEQAILRGEDGSSRIAFTLDNSGRVTEISVSEGSGSATLDSAAMAAVRVAAPFGPFTDDIHKQVLHVSGNFRYVLE